MFDISEWGDIWGIDAKKAVFEAWDPEKPRDYENFNPFERNLDGGVCDANGWCGPHPAQPAHPTDTGALACTAATREQPPLTSRSGCARSFPGESRGYQPPNRPDTSWAIMQKEKEEMEVVKADPKYGLSGKPGCYSLKWQEKLGAPP